MRWRRSEPDSAAEWAAEGVVGEEEMPPGPGWVATASTGALANAVVVARWVAWLLVCSGPVLGLVALVSVPSTAAPAPASTSQAAGRQPVQGPGGFAELAVRAYLSAGPQAAVFFPGLEQAGLVQQHGGLPVESVTALHVRRVAVGYWSVTVAARVAAPTGLDEKDSGQDASDGQSAVRYFQLPVHAGKDQRAWVAVSLPSEVPAPSRGERPALAYGTARQAVGSSDLVQALDDVFAAYLTGNGELGRYLSPGTSLSPVSPAPYQDVEVTELAEVGSNDPLSPEASRAHDGEERQLLVQVKATDGAGRAWPLTYALHLRARDGRWEIASLQAAPVLATNAAGPGGTHSEETQ